MSDYDPGFCETLGRGRLVSLDPEEVAHELLVKSGLAEAVPVDLDPILVRLGVHKVEADIDGDGYLIHLPSETYEMLVRPKASTGARQRFTMAHELGHYMLERLERSQGEQPGKYRVDDAPQGDVEKWCNRFASALLLPPRALQVVLGGPNGLLDAPRLVAAAKACEVSEEALAYRASGLYNAALATVDPEGKVTSLTPRFLDVGNNRANVQAAITQQMQAGKAAGDFVAAKRFALNGEQRTVFGLRKGRPVGGG